MNSRIFLFIPLLFLCYSCSKNTKKVLFISNKQVDCIGVAPQKCLDIKEERSTEWTFLYNAIEGFDYEEGFFYKIKVDVSEVDNTAADQSSHKYTLIEILEKSKTPLTLNNASLLVTRINDRDRFGRNPFIKIDLSKNEITGNTSCNRFSGKITLKKNNKVAFSKIVSTEMMCNEIDVETVFLDALKKITSYTLKEEKLELHDRKKKVIIECRYLEED